MPPVRDEKGRFLPGHPDQGAGRQKRTDEDKYNAVLLAVVLPARFQTMLEKQTRKAENGDLESFKYICKLLGLEVEKRELRGDFSLVIGWDDASET